MMKNEFDWHIQINKMQNLNDMIGKQLECVDAERLAHTRQKKIRSKAPSQPLRKQGSRWQTHGRRLYEKRIYSWLIP